MSELTILFRDVSALVKAELESIVQTDRPEAGKLLDAMRWSLFSSGKHFRPALVIAIGRTLGAADKDLARTAAAIEMMHTYSLIHDDLPAMDDDDMRRGREACHKKFGDATAILAGDALQALAFQAIADDPRIPASVRIELIRGLANAAASMVRGQHLDLEGEGRELSIAEIETIHENKTGSLISFSAEAGALIAGASEGTRAVVVEYAKELGLLFQITDDLLDVTQTSHQLGKTAGKDAAAGKGTYPSVLGIERTRNVISEVHARAIAAADTLDPQRLYLHAIADFLINRES